MAKRRKQVQNCRKKFRRILYCRWYGHKYHSVGMPSGANLCPYVRAVLFWAPLRFLFLGRVSRWVSWPLLVAAVEGLLWALFGPRVFVPQFIVLTAMVTLGMVIAIILGIEWAGDRVREHDTVQSFRQVLGAYYEAAHKHICPQIHLK